MFLLTLLRELSKLAMFMCLSPKANCSAVRPSLFVMLKSRPARHKHLTASISFFSVAALIEKNTLLSNLIL